MYYIQYACIIFNYMILICIIIIIILIIYLFHIHVFDNSIECNIWFNDKLWNFIQYCNILTTLIMIILLFLVDIHFINIYN
jgi:hypothetical protein